MGPCHWKRGSVGIGVPSSLGCPEAADKRLACLPTTLPIAQQCKRFVLLLSRLSGLRRRGNAMPSQGQWAVTGDVNRHGLERGDSSRQVQLAHVSQTVFPAQGREEPCSWPPSPVQELPPAWLGHGGEQWHCWGFWGEHPPFPPAGPSAPQQRTPPTSAPFPGVPHPQALCFAQC